MKKISFVFVLSLIIFGNCKNSTLVSDPPGFEVFSEGKFLGTTPYKFSVEKGKSPVFILKKKKYLDKTIVISKGKNNAKIILPYVISISGLRMRKSSTIKSKNIITIPYLAQVYILENKGKIEKIGKKQGKWLKAEYQDKKGYLFSAFVSDNSVRLQKRITCKKENKFYLDRKTGICVRPGIYDIAKHGLTLNLDGCGYRSEIIRSNGKFDIEDNMMNKVQCAAKGGWFKKSKNGALYDGPDSCVFRKDWHINKNGNIEIPGSYEILYFKRHPNNHHGLKIKMNNGYIENRKYGVPFGGC